MEKCEIARKMYAKVLPPRGDKMYVFVSTSVNATVACLVTTSRIKDSLIYLGLDLHIFDSIQTRE